MAKQSSSGGLGGRGPVPPDDASALDVADRNGWRQWMSDFGKRQRRLREFAGLSQQELARLAGVSQGAVSRLEVGRGLGTPLLIVLRINAVLVRELHRFDPSLLSPGLREAVELQSALVPRRGALGFNGVSIAEDPRLEELVRLYHESPGRIRQGVLSVLRAMVTGTKPTTPS